MNQFYVCRLCLEDSTHPGKELYGVLKDHNGIFLSSCKGTYIHICRDCIEQLQRVDLSKGENDD